MGIDVSPDDDNILYIAHIEDMSFKKFGLIQIQHTQY